jgi:lipopolysaccharide transport system ATP-binding protein
MAGVHAVRATGVGKCYRLGQLRTGYGLLSETIAARLRSAGRRQEKPERDFWALRDIDFEVDAGETFGIIGHNGAGKSTLLKILSRITPPTEGEIRLRGRVGALLEVGTGFHPELTGRENIYLNGAILGMPREEIRRKFDEIVEFAEIERFIDTPVKRYSSGMYLRLAFSVAAHLEPEILVIDEVLSVGDLAFQEKCLGRMETVAREGRTVLFVSHNLTAVQSLCNRAMLLSRGRKVTEGPAAAVIDEYVRSVGTTAAVSLTERQDREGSGRLRFEFVSFESDSNHVDMPVSGRDTEIVLGYSTNGQGARNVSFSITVYTLLGSVILQLQSDLTGANFAELPESGVIRCRMQRLALPPGRYWLNVFASSGGEVLDWVQHATDMTVAEGDFYGTGRRSPESHLAVLVDQEWEVSERDAAQLAPPQADGLTR